MKTNVRQYQWLHLHIEISRTHTYLQTHLLEEKKIKKPKQN